MRIVAVDLGKKKTAFCEVRDGVVVERATVRRLDELESRLGPGTPPARVAIEACRTAWHVHDRLLAWGHEVQVCDTTRAKQLGIGQHGRKTDTIDAERLALALAENRLPRAHVLSPDRRELREMLNVRRRLVETRAGFVAEIREVLRARGVCLRGCATDDFAARLQELDLDEALRSRVQPLVDLLRPLAERIVEMERRIHELGRKDDVAALLQTAPGVGLIVAAAFISVVDNPERFRSAHALESYLGLVPSEHTSGKRRLGSITKKGNSYLRAMLVQAAWSVLRAPGHAALAEWGRAVTERRGKRVGVVAVARRLAGVLWAMWRDGTVYDPAHVALASARGLERQAQDVQRRARAMARATGKVERAMRSKAARLAVAKEVTTLT